MSILINDQSLSKEELLKLIKKSKIGAVRHIKKLTHIGLNDARGIINNIAKNPDYYDGQVINKAVTGFKGTEGSLAALENAQNDALPTKKIPILGSHFLKVNQSNTLLKIALIGFALLLLYYFLKDKM